MNRYLFQYEVEAVDADDAWETFQQACQTWSARRGPGRLRSTQPNVRMWVEANGVRA